MFRSHDELFQATRELISSLEDNGNAAASRELREGLGCVNGLTDGWALFLESIDDVRRRYAEQLNNQQQTALAALHDAVYEAVCRRKPRRWWKIFGH